MDGVLKKKQELEGIYSAGVRVLVVTPLKALNNDIHDHLIHFMAEIEETASSFEKETRLEGTHDWGSYRRYQTKHPGIDAEAPARSAGDHTRIVVFAAYFPARERNAKERGTDRHRRNPRSGSGQARYALVAHAGTAERVVRAIRPADRRVSHAKAYRAGSSVSWRLGS